MRPFILVLSFFLVTTLGAREPGLRPQVKLLLAQGRGTAEGRAAWDKIVAAGPAMLPVLLSAMNQSDVVGANWLRTAFDRIADDAAAQGKVDVAPLLAFARDSSNNGRGRRLALDLVERLKPGTSEALFAEARMHDDSEFRFEAVAVMLASARTTLKKGDKGVARTLFQKSFEAARDVQQARDAAAGLLELGQEVSVARHLGFLLDWHLIGPFDAQGQKGFTLQYPPEMRVDLSEELEGQEKKVRWKAYKVKEAAPASSAKHQALVNLRERDAVGDADDAVAFAYTEFTVAKAQKVEFRGAADDNFTVWVNGAKVFGFEEYRNGVRLDRHRFAVDLRAGKNTVLVKICQTPAPNPEPNWEFFLRVVDSTGRGIEIQN